VGVPDRQKGEIVKAYVVLKGDEEATERQLINFAAKRLAPYKVPSKIEFREALPKSTVGKYLRRELVAEELERIRE
jgi:long-chain acyl-CoA synthetase